MLHSPTRHVDPRDQPIINGHHGGYAHRKASPTPSFVNDHLARTRIRRGRTFGGNGLSPLHSHILAFAGELVGTFFFLFLGYASNVVGGAQAASTFADGSPSNSTILFIAFGYGIPLMINVAAFGSVSGGHLNPAVTFAKVLVGDTTPIRGTYMVSAQVLASIGAGFIVSVIFPGKIASANTLIGGHANTLQSLFMEFFFTAQLVNMVLFLGASWPDAGAIAVPVGVGLSVVSFNFAGAGFDGASGNPARSLGCAVAGFSFPGYHWIYWLGPLAGGAASAGLFSLIRVSKRLEQESIVT